VLTERLVCTREKQIKISRDQERYYLRYSRGKEFVAEVKNESVDNKRQKGNKHANRCQKNRQKRLAAWRKRYFRIVFHFA
jgi:hypothetical protein